MIATGIRFAKAADFGAIRALLTEAFDGTAEADLVERLRADGDLALEQVAAAGEEVVGQVAYSRLSIDTETEVQIVALAPLAVAAAWRRRGIGAALVHASLDALRGRGCDLVLVLGDPAYYSRFGFVPAADLALHTPYDGPYQQALVLSGRDIRDLRITYAVAFAGLE